MAHSHMDHGDMGHGGDDGMMCNMNMLFTWDAQNLCVVFRSWRVTGPWSLLWTLVAIVALTAGYEAVREASRRYDARYAARLENMPRRSVAAEEQTGKIIRAAIYGVQVFYSFFIMLLFMTYNGWVMLAVGFGAFVGFLVFGGASSTKSVACH